MDTQTAAMRRASSASNKSFLSTASTQHTFTTVVTQRSWIPYATLRAESLVYHSLASRRQQSTLSQLLQEVRELPTTPRRHFLARERNARPRRASIRLPALPGEGEQCECQEETKEQLDSIQSIDAVAASTAPSATITSDAASASASPVEQTEVGEAEPSEGRSGEAESKDSADVLSAYVASSHRSLRLARLTQRQRERHAAELSALAAWEEHHKLTRQQRVADICRSFLASARSPSSSSYTAAVDALVSALLEDERTSLAVVRAYVIETVASLIDIGYALPAAIHEELRPAVERWNVWSLRNRKAVHELEWRLKADHWTRTDEAAQHQPQPSAVVTSS